MSDQTFFDDDELGETDAFDEFDNLDIPTADEATIARAKEAAALRAAAQQKRLAAVYHARRGGAIDRENPPSPEPSHGIAPMHSPVEKKAAEKSTAKAADKSAAGEKK